MSQKTKNNQGSILVFTLIILSLVLITALGIAASTVSDLKSSNASGKSTQGFQAADTGIEIVAKKVREASATDKIGYMLGGRRYDSRSDNRDAYVYDTSLGTDKASTITFLPNSDGSGAALLFGDTVDKIKSIKAVGTYNGTTRAVQAPVSNQQATMMADQAASGIIAYWQLDLSNETDSVGSYVATLTNVTIDNSKQKIGKGAGEFNGTSSYASIAFANGSSLDIAAKKPVTMEAWIKPATISGNQRIFSRGLASIQGYGMTLLSTGVINVGRNGGGNCSGTTVLKTDQWYHVVGVIREASSSDSKQDPQIYINGKLDSLASGCTGVWVNPVVAANLGAQIGAGYSATQAIAEYFKGEIDEVAIYNRELTQTEIQSHR